MPFYWIYIIVKDKSIVIFKILLIIMVVTFVISLFIKSINSGSLYYRRYIEIMDKMNLFMNFVLREIEEIELTNPCNRKCI